MLEQVFDTKVSVAGACRCCEEQFMPFASSECPWAPPDAAATLPLLTRTVNSIFLLLITEKIIKREEA